jgi:hypothetical protein
MTAGSTGMLTSTDRATLADAARPAARLAFAALIVLSPFRARVELVARPMPPLYGDYTDFLLFWSDIALVATLVFWALSLIARPRSVSFGPLFLALPAAGLIVVAFAGVPSSVDPGLAAYNAIRMVALAGLALYALNEIERLEQLAVPIAAMIVLQAIVEIGQVVGQQSIGLGLLGEYTLNPTLPVSVVTSAEGIRLLRGYGLADHPNILGGLLAFGLLLLGAGMRRADRQPVFRTLIFALGVLTLLLTFSRSALLALVVGLVVIGIMLAHRRDLPSIRAWLAMGFAAVIVCAPFITPYQPYFAARADASGVITTEARSIDERQALADQTNQIFIANIALGVGIGALPIAMLAANPTFPFTYQPAGTVVLDVAAEMGIAGAIFYFGLLVLPWLALLRHRQQWTAELAAASAALAAVSVVGLFDYYTWSFSAGRIWAWIVLGLWARAYRNATAEVTDA